MNKTNRNEKPIKAFVSVLLSGIIGGAAVQTILNVVLSDFASYAGPGNSGTPNSSDFLGKPAGTYTTMVNYLSTTP